MLSIPVALLFPVKIATIDAILSIPVVLLFLIKFATIDAILSIPVILLFPVIFAIKFATHHTMLSILVVPLFLTNLRQSTRYSRYRSYLFFLSNLQQSTRYSWYQSYLFFLSNLRWYQSYRFSWQICDISYDALDTPFPDKFATYRTMLSIPLFLTNLRQIVQCSRYLLYPENINRRVTEP
jgi:hypothetical protein